MLRYASFATMRKIFGKQRALLGIVTFLIVAGMLSLIVDIQVARLMDLNPIPKGIGRILRFSEIGGHGTGAAMVLIGVIACSQFRGRRSEERMRALRLIAGTYLGGLIVDLFKLIIPRVRPGKAILENANGFFDTFGHQLLDAGIHGRSFHRAIGPTTNVVRLRPEPVSGLSKIAVEAPCRKPQSRSKN